MNEGIEGLRRDFQRAILLETDIPRDPFDLLGIWYQAAAEGGEIDPNAMSLSTIDDDGYPVSRIVLMRGLSSQGLTFFTNYKSAKGRHLEARPKAEVQFFWRHLERQVRVRGVVKKISAEESDHYFASRPRDSQIGAWASPQSQVIRSRDELEDLFRTFSAKFADLEAVPRPPHWGGFRLEATDVEFWQGRSNRLHDRLCARRVGQDWHWQRLAP